jgi:hypothetical protein
MRCLSLIVRHLTKAGSLFVLMLLVASTAEAARGPRRSPVRRECAPDSTTINQLRRQPRAFGGPIAQLSPRVLVGLTDPTTRIARASETDDDDDGQAIQNDAPAAHVDLDGRGVPMLRPLGLLVGSFDPRPRTRAFSPKSPRGPPASL